MFSFFLMSSSISHSVDGESSHVHGYMPTHQIFDLHAGAEAIHSHSAVGGIMETVETEGLTILITLFLASSFVALIFLTIFTTNTLKYDKFLKLNFQSNYWQRRDSIIPIHTLLFSTGILNPKLY